MARSHDAREEEQPDLHIEPLFNHVAVNAGGLDQDEGQDRSGHQLPGTLHPEVDHPPPVVPVDDNVLIERNAEEVQQGQKQQPAQERSLHHCPPIGLEHGHAHVEQEQQGADDHNCVQGPGDLQERSSLGPAEHEAHNGHYAGHD